MPGKPNNGTASLQQSGERISQFPYDILYLIFEHLKIAEATCLGLTCRTFYKHLKAYHPDPISLDACCCHLSIDDCEGKFNRCVGAVTFGGSPQVLGYRLEYSSIAEGYRIFHVYRSDLRLSYPLRLLKEDVFGPDHYNDSGINSRKEAQLASRFRDYFRDYSRTRHSFCFIKYRSYLPSPVNLGDAWTSVALEAIKKDFGHSRHATPEDWKRYWWRFRVVRKNRQAFEVIWKEETEKIGST